MDKQLIINWNNKVPKDGMVFMLGDFCWSDRSERWVKILSQLNGTIYHIRGNHDYYQITEYSATDLKIQKPTVYDLLEIEIEQEDEFKQKLVLCHFPLLTWHQKERGAWHLYGHCHGSVDHPHSCAIDVGIDTKYCINYSPFSYEEVQTIITQKFLKTL